MDNGTGIDEQTLQNSKKISEAMRQLPPEEAKLVLVYASALHDRTLIESSEKKPVAG